MITHIAHGAITVKDMEASLKFYTEALGFKKVFEINEPNTGAPWIVYLNISKGEFMELFYDGTVDNPWRSELIGFNHFCLEVDDIKMGVDYNWQAWVTDPNGVRIELMQIDPRSPHAKYC